MTEFQRETGLTPNPSVESWIASFDVPTADLIELPLDKINHTASVKNQARLVSIDKALAHRYAQAMAAGAVFPPIVVADTRQGYVVIDGNHRVKGFKTNGVETHMAYVVKVTEVLRTMMTITANNLNGLPPSDEERRAHARTLAAFGLASSQIALHTGLPSSTVGDILRVDKLLDRAGRQGTKVHAKTLRFICQIQSGPVCAALIDAVQSAGANPDQAKEAVSAVMEQQNEADQLTEVERFAQLWQAEAAMRKRPVSTKAASESAKCTRAVGAVLALRPELIAQNMTGDVDDMRARLLSASKHLAAIAEAM